MWLQERDVIIQEIVDECSQQQTETGGNKELMKWRAKLEKEPPFLKPFQIDDIIREARRRLSNLGR